MSSISVSERAPPHSAEAASPTLILMHGAGAGQAHWFMDGLAESLSVHGIRVITFDFPYVTAGRRLPDRMPDLLSTLDEVVADVARRRPRSSLFVGGKSLGGRTAVTWLVNGGHAAGYVAFGFPLQPPRGRPQPERAALLARVEHPGLIVQGTRDEFGDAVTVAAAAPMATTVHDLPGANHAFAVAGRHPEHILDELGAVTADFIRNTVATADRPKR